MASIYIYIYIYIYIIYEIFHTLSKVREIYSIVLILQCERYVSEETTQIHIAH